MKKIYTKPEIAVVDIKPTQLLSGSGDTLTIPVETESGDPVIDNEKNVW
jgi:hypothetical protein